MNETKNTPLTKIVKGQSGRVYTCRQIVARISEPCSRCGRTVLGDLIWWAQGLRPFHVTCPSQPAHTPSQPAASASQPSSRQTQPAHTPSQPARTPNRRGGYCSRCGTYVPAGQGWLWRCLGSDSGCMQHFDEEGGWHVSHQDRSICDARKAEQEQLRKAAEERANEIVAIRTSLRAAFQDGQRPQLTEWPRGTTLANTLNVYGSGDCYILTDDTAWYIKANSMDGDDWSENNAPGAIATCIPRDDNVVSMIQRLHDLLSARS